MYSGPSAGSMIPCASSVASRRIGSGHARGVRLVNDGAGGPRGGACCAFTQGFTLGYFRAPLRGWGWWMLGDGGIPVPKCKGPFGFARGRLAGTLGVVWRGRRDRGRRPTCGPIRVSRPERRAVVVSHVSKTGRHGAPKLLFRCWHSEMRATRHSIHTPRIARVVACHQPGSTRSR